MPLDESALTLLVNTQLKVELYGQPAAHGSEDALLGRAYVPLQSLITGEPGLDAVVSLDGEGGGSVRVRVYLDDELAAYAAHSSTLQVRNGAACTDQTDSALWQQQWQQLTAWVVLLHRSVAPACSPCQRRGRCLPLPTPPPRPWSRPWQSRPRARSAPSSSTPWSSPPAPSPATASTRPSARSCCPAAASRTAKGASGPSPGQTPARPLGSPPPGSRRCSRR